MLQLLFSSVDKLCPCMLSSHDLYWSNMQQNNSYTQPYSYHMEFSPFPFALVDRLLSSAVFVAGARLPWLGLGGPLGVT
jgi:hypothetical protein